MSLINVETEFLKLLIDALSKRSKAIKHSVVSYLCESEKDEFNEVEIERLNIDLELNDIHSSIVISVWEDRWCFVNVRKKTTNNKYLNCKVEGRIGGIDLGLVVEAIEQTIKTSNRDKSDNLCRTIKKHWDQIVLTGPRKQH